MAVAEHDNHILSVTGHFCSPVAETTNFRGKKERQIPSLMITTLTMELSQQLP